MKKILTTILVLDALGGGAWMLWRFTEAGKNTLANWLLNRWTEMAHAQQKSLPWEHLKDQLKKLDYLEIETLLRYTLLDPLGKERAGQLDARSRSKSLHYLQRLHHWGVFERTELQSLDNLVLPG